MTNNHKPSRQSFSYQVLLALLSSLVDHISVSVSIRVRIAPGCSNVRKCLCSFNHMSQLGLVWWPYRYSGNIRMTLNVHWYIHSFTFGYITGNPFKNKYIKQTSL